MAEKNKVLGGCLYLVGTPIGNMQDLSERAKKVLSEVNFIAAEDTRNSYKLLSLIGVSAELVSYHEHNKKSAGERIIARLLSGESCALITDAGMPAISDPGEDLVRLCAESAVKVVCVPGPSAVVSALAMSALSTRKFAFEGFLSAKATERRRELEAVKSERRTVVFYEAPHKLKSTLSDMCDILGGERKISLCREITKLNEEVLRLTLAEAVEYYEINEPRGEFVLVVEGASEDGADGEKSPLLSLTPEEHIEHYINEGLSKKDAIKAVAKDRGVPKSEIYKYTI